MLEPSPDAAGVQPHGITKWLVRGVPLSGKLSVCHGVSYRFAASAWDLTTLPAVGFSIVRVLHQLPDAHPKVWRTNADRREAIVELESQSDAGLSSMRAEANRCWEAFSRNVSERARWMHLIGGHDDILKRMLSPLAHVLAEVRTLQDDYLARMYAQGSAEIALQAELLHALEKAQALAPRDPLQSDFENFLWPSAGIPSWAAGRYASALAGGFCTIQTSFAEAGVPA